MEFLVEARTQTGAVCVFDAAGLPPEGEPAAAAAAAETRAALARAGRAWFARTPGNGAWPVLLRVDEDGTGAQGTTPLQRGTLAVPSGRLWVCGAEFLARDPVAGGPGTPEGGLARHAMGDCVQLPAGTYAFSVFDKDPAAAAVRPSGGRRELGRALEFGGYLGGGIGVASAAWTLYALWLGDTDETWQEVLRQNVPAILAFLVVGWAVLYVGRVLQGFESARRLAEGGTADGQADAGIEAAAAAGAAPTATVVPAYVLVLSRIGSADPV